MSLTTFLIFNSGLCAWLLYGFFLRSAPIIVANMITLYNVYFFTKNRYKGIN
ncbi:MAG: hypothetical protein NZ455_15725 [Bacteroidia bacterium]|nr:hypothetical protein [Bacteroidia bacterium]MDW8347156.1 hypothetical protein [Bacteroidia bacterium]